MTSTQIKPSHMAFGRTIDILYLLTYLLVLYHLLSPEPAPGTGWHCLTVIHWWCFGGLWKAACRMGQRFATSVMLLFGLQNLCMWKKLEV